MNEISSHGADILVHRQFIAEAYKPAPNARPKVIEMIKLLTVFRRPAAPRTRRPADPATDFSPRDWADLPTYHPASDEPRR